MNKRINRRRKSNKKVDARQKVNILDQIKHVETGIKDGSFVFTGPLSISEFSSKIGKSSGDIIKFFFIKGVAYNLNTVLNEEQIAEVCLEFGYDFSVEEEVSEENLIEKFNIVDEEKDMEIRAPIITIMGHVDHGKTTLLDAIREANVVKQEAGGITQHVGAYQINYDSKKITFIDTPGHEAFSKMRARGANLTDIIILVVSADDGIMPQTEEAIDHAKYAKVPIIVFVNKMDKQGANPEKVMSQLAEKEILSEEWGGSVPFIKGSALKKEGIKELLSTINLISDINEYKSNPNRMANGIVLESNLDKGLGPVATLIITAGTLKKSDIILAGSTYGKVRLMQDHNKKVVDSGLPGDPVVVSGFIDVPVAGDKFLVMSDENSAKQLAQSRHQKIKREGQSSISAEIKQQIEDGTLKNINLIIKSDVHGSLEAIKQLISKIEVNGATITIIRAAIGTVTESDLLLAQTASAMIYTFNIRTQTTVQDMAKEKGIDIRFHNIIYKLKEELEDLLKGKLDPIIEEKIMGQAEVQELWKHSSIGTIAGCKVKTGVITNKSKARVIRDDVVVYESSISSLKHLKNDIKEAKAGKECGMTIKNFNDLKIGDIIEVYKSVEVENNG